MAFDAFATGNETITSLTELLEDAGLRTRATPTRPSRPVSRSSVHRILRDDYYTGTVTLKGVKYPGRHEAIIDQATFERVQEALSGHAASGDRSQKHHHYLKGSIYCPCGRRLGYGRHRGNGGVYEYFSCLSRVTRGGRCGSPHFDVGAVEKAIESHYDAITFSPVQQNAIRAALRTYCEAKTEVAKREADRHARRLRTLTADQQKLVQLHYRNLVSDEVLAAEQERIERERADATRWEKAAVTEVKDVLEALDEALGLVDAGRPLYRQANRKTRRLLNQAIFRRLIVGDADTIESEPTPVYSQLAHVALQTTSDPKGRTETTMTPISQGHGSYFVQMAEREGFEPSSELTPATRFPVAPVQPLRHLSGTRGPED
ncbi:MAG: hypothetical protein QOE65_2946 [Solirubrobacteraceae bacterium]|nr:hypothetical protein [Solirubrobacteraceae bacterium]